VIRDLRERGIPLDGLGHEMHNNINYPSTDAMVHAIDTIAWDFPGLDQQITEMDVSVYNAGDSTSNYAPTVPPSLIAEQGWLYEEYFDALRRLRDKISSVTFWGFADDDTWLDSFPIDRLDLPLPFDTELQAKPAYWGIVDETQLPGYGLSFSVSDDKGDDKDKEHDTRVFTVTAKNGDVGIAYATQINGFTLQQFAGERCRPVVTAPSGYPIALGDLAVGGSASATFTVSFAGCGDFADFVLIVPWSSATYDTGTFVTVIHHRRDHDRRF
jgi:endo-1,4-beta-xylanase